MQINNRKGIRRYEDLKTPSAVIDYNIQIMFLLFLKF